MRSFFYFLWISQIHHFSTKQLFCFPYFSWWALNLQLTDLIVILRPPDWYQDCHVTWTWKTPSSIGMPLWISTTWRELMWKIMRMWLFKFMKKTLCYVECKSRCLSILSSKWAWEEKISTFLMVKWSK